jgi:hypothetical protein
MLTDIEKETIRNFAASDPPDKRLLAEATIVFRRFLMLNPHLSVDDWPVEILFMSEVDNPCPDYILKCQFREKCLPRK